MKTIGVFFGSRNPEHDVSIITGQLIISELKKLGYPVVPVYINKKGEWLIADELGTLKSFTNPESRSIKDAEKYYVDIEESVGKMTLKQKGMLGKKIVIDIAFPAFHGQYGEDGTFQGFCEMLNVPYIGCDVTSSGITMDKVLTKMVYKANNIPTTPFIWFMKSQFETNRKEILTRIETDLPYPVIVKPARLGSSIGIAKAKDQKELEFAIEVALKYDEKVIVEMCIDDLMDVTCAVMGNDQPIPSLLQESVFDSDVFSYEDKYLKEGGAQLGNAKQNMHIPARLDEPTTQEIRTLAGKIFTLIGCSGISRVDFLYDKKTKKYYANEINTLPGTLYHHLWKASGVSLSHLIENLLGFAEERHRKKQEIAHTFESAILKHAGSVKLQLKG